MSGKVKTFDGATTLFRGLRSLPGPGHTPGHSSYVLQSRGEKIMFRGVRAAGSGYRWVPIPYVYDAHTAR